jgi:hypothetical protein
VKSLRTFESTVKGGENCAENGRNLRIMPNIWADQNPKAPVAHWVTYRPVTIFPIRCLNFCNWEEKISL